MIISNSALKLKIVESQIRASDQTNFEKAMDFDSEVYTLKKQDQSGII